MDGQGRILIHPLVREAARIDGEVAVIGAQDHLEIWNRTAFEKQLKSTPLTDAELEKLASYGI
jgi:DNA-binding transcriptional regulator/RsmH inhibitor MraZ